MKRKVMLHGPSTLTISLPAKWVKCNNIRKGDELDLQLFGPILHVYSEKINEQNDYTIDISSLSNNIVKMLLACLHKNGYEKLILQHKPEQIPVIQKRINTMLLGYEIVDITADTCVVKTIAKTSNTEFDNILRRIFLVTLALAEGVYTFVSGNEFEKLDELLTLEETNNKLTNYLERLISQQFSSKERLSYIYLISWIQENIADEYKKICFLLKKEKNVSPSLLQIFKELHLLLYELYKFFYDFSFVKLQSIITKKCRIEKQIESLFVKKHKKEEIQILFLLFSINRHVGNSLGSMIAHHN